jgi:ABC-2 type transport system ATP-binding protein
MSAVMNNVVSARGLRKATRTSWRSTHRLRHPGGPHRRPDRPNGAGKTTALKAILGLIPFDGS